MTELTELELIEVCLDKDEIDNLSKISKRVDEELLVKLVSIIEEISVDNGGIDPKVKAALISGLIAFSARSLQLPFAFGGIEKEKIEIVANGIFEQFKCEFNKCTEMSVKFNNEKEASDAV